MSTLKANRDLQGELSHVAVVGAGGNIGSHLVPHLGRMPGIGSVTLIDRDHYESANLASQAITPRDVGRSKAGVQARILRRIDSSLTVTALNHAVEDLPLGRMRADVIVACLDSRSARQYVNQAAWRLGVPWIDAGVEARGLLARVNTYVPGGDNPCLECAWDQRDYEALEQTYPCLAGQPAAFATNAPSSLGALAASLEAIECQKLISKRIGEALASQQLVVDARYHKHYLTSFRRNPNCRLFDHRPWKIRRLNLAVHENTGADLLSVAGTGGKARRLSLAGKSFVAKAICRDCGRQVRRSAFLGLSNGVRSRCSLCGGAMFVSGSERADWIDLQSGTTVFRRRTLQRLGIRAGDIVTVESGNTQVHIEIAEG